MSYSKVHGLIMDFIHANEMNPYSEYVYDNRRGDNHLYIAQTVRVDGIRCDTKLDFKYTGMWDKVEIEFCRKKNDGALDFTMFHPKKVDPNDFGLYFAKIPIILREFS
jgi:hypothetical protein